jgi:hypothetical protein
MNIIFHSDQLSERGTEVALFDYATGNQNVLGNRSFIAVAKNKVLDENVLKKFSRNFTICLYESLEELRNFAEANKIDLIYKIEHGKKGGLLHDKIPHFIHCVFSTRAKYGAFYCPISQALNKRCGTKYPVLPHIVKPFGVETDKVVLRKKLGISQDAFVFGCYGGSESFNISFVKNCVENLAKKAPNIHFIFMNISKFCDLPNVHFLPKSIVPTEKAHFIDACTAMLHARSNGETFGLSIAEFSIRNKPIITFKPIKSHEFISRLLRKLQLAKFLPQEFLGLHFFPKYDKAHLDYNHKAITYSGRKELLHILENFEKYYAPNENYDCYSERFSEKNVMETFRDIIDGRLKDRERT